MFLDLVLFFLIEGFFFDCMKCIILLIIGFNFCVCLRLICWFVVIMLLLFRVVIELVKVVSYGKLF